MTFKEGHDAFLGTIDNMVGHLLFVNEIGQGEAEDMKAKYREALTALLGRVREEVLEGVRPEAHELPGQLAPSCSEGWRTVESWIVDEGNVRLQTFVDGATGKGGNLDAPVRITIERGDSLPPSEAGS